MHILHLKNNKPPIRTVPLEDWYEELSDETLSIESQLIQAEDDAEHNEITEGYDIKLSQLQSLGESAMSSSTAQNNTPKFDVKAFLATARALNDSELATASKVAQPNWLILHKDHDFGCTISNRFWITSGVIKSVRGIMDAINYTQRELEFAIERLTMQELRAGRTAAEVHNFDPGISKIGIQLAYHGGAHEDVYDDDGTPIVSGFNPDGQEFDLALVEAVELVDKLETIVANGEHILQEAIEWVEDHAEQLQLEVETGHTVKLGPIGNEIRKPRMERLTPITLLVGIQLQREFIRGIRS